MSVTDGNGVVQSGSSFIGNINPIRYRGYYYDTETGLYYLQSRYYDPETGRFINADAIDKENQDNVFSRNLYAYCYNDPVNNVDPTGYLVGVDDACILIILGLVLITTTMVAATANNSQNTDVSMLNPFSDLKTKILSYTVLVTAITQPTAKSFSKSKSKSESKSVPNSITQTQKLREDRPRFPDNPYSFHPKGCTLRMFPGSDNGRTFKWFYNGQVVFEWNEDYKYGQHFHVAYGERARLSRHYWPGEYIPEPQASIFFY